MAHPLDQLCHMTQLQVLARPYSAPAGVSATAAARSVALLSRLWRRLFGVVVDVVVQLEHRRAGNMRRRLLDEL